MRSWMGGCLLMIVGLVAGACDGPEPDASGDVRQGELCSDSRECAPEEYCAVAEGECGARGTCELRPTECEPDRPVCGCDEATYKSACDAQAAGVSVDYQGECAPPGCLSNAECGTGEYCAKASGDCGGYGACTPKPVTCSAAYVPVCGCNGFTYSNACKAAKGGVSINYNGKC